MIDTGLRGKVVLVTGANHGIGAATAKAFSTVGAPIFINYLGAPSPGPVVRTIREAGGQVDVWEADLADPATIPVLFDRAEAALGPVDILVNNAAASGRDTFIPPGPTAIDWADRPVRMPRRVTTGTSQ